VILQRAIEREQLKKLLRSRRTDLIEEFISRAGKPFSAYLVMDDSGKVTFDFPPREP
jgi:DNA topoisomerase-3